MVSITPRSNHNGRPTGKKVSLSSNIVIAASAFLFGCLVSSMVVLNFVAISTTPPVGNLELRMKAGSILRSNNQTASIAGEEAEHQRQLPVVDLVEAAMDPAVATASAYANNPLAGKRILIAIAAFDFNQIPHLGEVLDAYQDLCLTGATRVDVVVHATIAYPVTLIDLLNSRLLPGCRDIFSIKIVLKPKKLRLHLVDCHRELFYNHIDDYDLFIYTEDDIRVPPRVVGAFLSETQKVEDLVGPDKFADFNVGIVRYEYNFPSNVVMDDKTRHATMNVTRVYWEHGFTGPGLASARFVEDPPTLANKYISMRNAHQGMFLATSKLLKKWKRRKNCRFDEARNRPARKNEPSQPAEGTQRVWMSSVMLHGKKHCNVQQVIPVDSFGSLTVLHLPNKNYRRVGRYRNRTFSDGTEHFEVSSSLLTEMRLHIDLRNATTQKPRIPYDGILMVDEVGDKRRDRPPVLERRLGEYQAYVDRGGILSPEDMTKTALVEER